MEINLRRNTGFYGMGSPLKVTINGKTVGSIKHQETKQFQIPEDTADVAVAFYWLKSKSFHLAKRHSANLEITMNLQMIQFYLVMFVLFLVVPAMLKSLWVLVLLLIIYGWLLASFMKQAYQIKEIQ